MAIHTPEGLALITKDTLTADSASMAAKASGLTIADAESYVRAGQLLRSVKAWRAEVQQWFAPHVEAAKETKRKADAARAGLVAQQEQVEAPLVAAEATIKRALLAWETTQEQIRRDEERRLQVEAQRNAEALTLAAAAEMELEAAATGDVEMMHEAEAILAQPVEAPVVSVAKLMPKVQGVSYRDQWKAHPDIDVKALAAAVAAGLAPKLFLLPNMTAINQFARATQGAETVPGVRFWNDRQVTAKA